MSYRIIWEPPQGVLRQHTGEVSRSELLHAVTDIASDHRFDNLRYIIVDYSACTAITASENDFIEVSTIEDAARHTNSRIRVAIVATLESFTSKVDNYIDLMDKGYERRCFATMAEARAWLARAMSSRQSYKR